MEKTISMINKFIADAEAEAIKYAEQKPSGYVFMQDALKEIREQLLAELKEV
jgi:hypothetical protein